MYLETRQLCIYCNSLNFPTRANPHGFAIIATSSSYQYYIFWNLGLAFKPSSVSRDFSKAYPDTNSNEPVDPATCNSA